MSGFTSRIQTMLEAKISALLDDIENPRETLDYAFEEQRELLRNVRDGIDSLVATKRRLQGREESLRARAAELEAQARREVAGGSEEIARAAVAAKTAIEAELDTVDDQIDDLERELAELSAKERDLTAKVGELKTKKQALTVDPDGDMSDLGQAMQRVIDKMGAMDSRATAVDRVGPGPAQASPDAREDDPIRHLAELEAHRSVDEELARMRREIEPPPPAA